MVGAVRGVDPTTGFNYDAYQRYIEALPLSAADKASIYSGNARRVFPRLDATVESQRLMSAAAKPYIPFHPNPSRSRVSGCRTGARGRSLPCLRSGFGFPFAPERNIYPADASKQQLFALRDLLGFSRNVIVQATCHGKDNAALLDALKTAATEARGVVTIGPDIWTGNCKPWMRPACGACVSISSSGWWISPRSDVLTEIAGRIAPLGWHVVIYFEAVDLAELWDFFTALPTTVVVDHMGRPDVAKGVDGPEFAFSGFHGRP